MRLMVSVAARKKRGRAAKTTAQAQSSQVMRSFAELTRRYRGNRASAGKHCTGQETCWASIALGKPRTLLQFANRNLLATGRLTDENARPAQSRPSAAWAGGSAGTCGQVWQDKKQKGHQQGCDARNKQDFKHEIFLWVTFEWKETSRHPAVRL